MSYILCIPNVQYAAYEDCEYINQVMKRLEEGHVLEIESVPTNFQLYSGPDNCRKYRIHLSDSAKLPEIRRKHEYIMNAAQNKTERIAMSCFMYYFGDKGKLITLYDYIESLERAQSYSNNLKALQLEMAA